MRSRATPTSSAWSGSRIPEPGDAIQIRYRRPPDREELFEQRFVARDGGTIVTLLEAATVKRPLLVDGLTILEPGSPIVWFTFAGERHDIGRFHRADGAFTGLYANVLTPVQGLDTADWATTDLFLDVWLPASGVAPQLLDEDELAEAAERGWIDATTAASSRTEGARLIDAFRSGAWPPPIVHRWTLDRAREHLRHTDRSAV